VMASGFVYIEIRDGVFVESMFGDFLSDRPSTSNSRFFCHVQGRARSEVEVEGRLRPSRRYGYLFRPTIMSLHYVEQIRGY
jgi:hypothetical protein